MNMSGERDRVGSAMEGSEGNGETRTRVRIIRTLSDRWKRGDRSWFRETASEKESKFDG